MNNETGTPERMHRRSTRGDTLEKPDKVYGAPTDTQPKKQRFTGFDGVQRMSYKLLDLSKTWYQNVKVLLRIAVIGTLGGFLWLYMKYDQAYGLAWNRVVEFWVDDTPTWLGGVWDTVWGFVTGLM